MHYQEHPSDYVAARCRGLAGRRRKELLTVCSWCKDALLNSEWVPLEQAIKELDLLGSMAAPRTR